MPLKKSNTITLLSIILILISVRGLLVLFIGRKDFTNYIYYNTLFIALFLSKFGFELRKKKDLLSRIPSGEPDVTPVVNPQI